MRDGEGMIRRIMLVDDEAKMFHGLERSLEIGKSGSVRTEGTFRLHSTSAFFRCIYNHAGMPLSTLPLPDVSPLLVIAIT